MKKIDKLFAFITIDNGDEGIIGIKVSDQWIPLVGADMERVESLKPHAQKIANHSGTTIALIEFETRRDVETIEPDGDKKDA